MVEVRANDERKMRGSRGREKGKVGGVGDNEGM